MSLLGALSGPRQGTELFAFDPRRTAILLIGGDKRDRWQEFYAQMMPLADQHAASRHSLRTHAGTVPRVGRIRACFWGSKLRRDCTPCDRR